MLGIDSIEPIDFPIMQQDVGYRVLHEAAEETRSRLLNVLRRILMQDCDLSGLESLQQLRCNKQMTVSGKRRPTPEMEIVVVRYQVASHRHSSCTARVVTEILSQRYVPICTRFSHQF